MQVPFIRLYACFHKKEHLVGHFYSASTQNGLAALADFFFLSQDVVVIMWISKPLVKAFQKKTVAANRANEILSDITKLFIEYMKKPSGQIGQN